MILSVIQSRFSWTDMYAVLLLTSTLNANITFYVVALLPADEFTRSLCYSDVLKWCYRTVSLERNQSTNYQIDR